MVIEQVPGIRLSTDRADVSGKPSCGTQADSSGVVQQTSPFEPGDSEALLECRVSGATTSPFRDVSTLNWLYFSAPHIRNDRLVFTARSAGRLVGFAAFKILGESLLLECRCIDADPSIAARLLAISRDRWASIRRRIAVHLAIHTDDRSSTTARQEKHPKTNDVCLQNEHSCSYRKGLGKDASGR